MNHIEEMMQSNPAPASVSQEALAELIDSCFDCAQACTACADACLGEGDHVQEMVRCIRLDLDCADLCNATARIMSRQTAFEPVMGRAAIEACARAVRLCGDECETHAEQHDMEHCRHCAETCRRCENACNAVLQEL